jgi:hypothetical protein
MAKKTIVLLGCFDTKGEPYSWLRDRIASNVRHVRLRSDFDRVERVRVTSSRSA